MSVRSVSVALALLVSLSSLAAQDAAQPVVSEGLRTPYRDLAAFQATTLHDDGVRIRWEADGSYGFAWRSDFLGQELQAEGIAWGRANGQRVLMDRCHIRIRGCEFADQDIGRLVRIIGTLRYEGQGWSRFGTTPPYFFIESHSYEVIERVRFPGLKEVNETDEPHAPTTE